MKKFAVITLALALSGGCAFAASSSGGTSTTQDGKASIHQIGSALRGSLHKIGDATRNVFHRAEAAMHRDTQDRKHTS